MPYLYDEASPAELARPAPFCYRARVSRVVDGDTIHVVVDLGFGQWAGLDKSNPFELRLKRIDTPETRRGSAEHRAAGRAATKFVNEWLAKAVAHDPGEKWPLLFRSRKDDDFGRYLAELWGAHDDMPLHFRLHEAGFAKEDNPA